MSRRHWCGTSPPARSRGWRRTTCPAQLCAFTAGVLRAEARQDPGYYDLVHSHYWLSGQVGWLARERWGVPLVHSAHTLAKVKNAALADGDTPEPRARVIGEEQVVAEADRLIASTADEADAARRPLRRRPGHGAHRRPRRRPRRLRPRRPGRRPRPPRPAPGRADPAVRRPHPAAQGARRAAARRRRCCSTTRSCAGRLQVVVLGAPSGTGLGPPAAARDAARRARPRRRRHVPPAGRRAAVVADYYRAADLTVVPSYNESFGLVALESQACGTPVVAAARRRPAHRRRRRRFGPAGRRARSRPVGQGARRTCCARRPCSRGWRRGAGRTPSGSPGTARPTACSWPTARRSTQRGRTPRGTGDPRRDAWQTRSRRRCSDLDVEWQRLDEPTFAVALPGEKRLKTACVLTVGAHALAIEAFVLRRPDENREQVYAWLLQRNARMYASPWSIDSHGDVYLVGRLPLARDRRRGARPHPRLRAGVLRRLVQRAARDGLRLVHQARVGVAGQERPAAREPAPRSPTSRNGPDPGPATAGRMGAMADPGAAAPRRERLEPRRTCSPAGSTST